QTRQIDAVLTMIRILLAAAILIAVLGIVNTLALSVLERTREIGLLRAVGLTRAATMRMITVESVVIALLGAVLGMVVGTGLAVRGAVNARALTGPERTRAFGLLRAVGLTRAATMRMITVESVVIALFGAVLGRVVGTGLGLAVSRALREEGISRLAVPTTELVVYLVLAALVGVVAAVIPAIRAARVDVLRAIAYG